MSKTLYVSDLDGTLLRKDETLSDFTITTINQLVEAGMLFSYATARSFQTAKKVAGKLDAQIPLIVYNGAMIIDNVSQKILISNFFKKDIHSVILDLIAKDVYPIVYSFIDGHEYFSFVGNKVNLAMRKFLNTRNGDPRYREIKHVEELLQGDIFYLTCIDEQKKLFPFYKKYQDQYHCIYEKDIYSEEQWFEMMPCGVCKAKAILQLKEYLNCDEIVVFGDGKNDLEMFEVANQAYAVKNANEILKAKATAVIESNEKDGVALWLYQHIKSHQKR